MKSRYLIMPDYVYSENDGQKHFIDAKRLIALYGVNPNECVIYDPNRKQITSGLIVLGPLKDGKYREYLEELEKAKWIRLNLKNT